MSDFIFLGNIYVVKIISFIHSFMMHLYCGVCSKPQTGDSLIQKISLPEWPHIGTHTISA